MALTGARCIFQDIKIAYTTHKFNFSSSCSRNNKWRKEQGLEPNPTRYGPLTNLPDFSYVDGRPVPLSARKLDRHNLQKKYCQRIIELTHEIDVGLKNYHERQEEIKKEREDIISNKLKPKGAELLKNNSEGS